MTNEAKSTEESEGLSRRDALEVAVAAVKDKESQNERSDGDVDRAGSNDRGRASSSEPVEGKEGGDIESGGTDAAGGLQPPSEFSKEEKEDFYASSRKAQEAALRLHSKRQQVFSEIQRDKALVAREKEELKSLRDLSSSMEPYLKAVGVKKPTEVALKEALGMWKEFNDGDPREAAAAYLEAKGIEVPQGLIDPEKKQDTQKNTDLQNRLSQLENVISAGQTQAVRQVLGQAWNLFETEKNAAGKPTFPDIASDTEEAKKLAGSIGSLVSGRTDLSKQFIALARERIPNLDYRGLLKEAYKYLGGKVDESSQTTRSQDSQKHIVNAGRASLSKPGRGAAIESNGSVKKFKTRREAYAAALEQLKEEA